eukprot:1739607-Prymnesium_polylepis.1
MINALAERASADRARERSRSRHPALPVRPEGGDSEADGAERRLLRAPRLPLRLLPALRRDGRAGTDGLHARAKLKRKSERATSTLRRSCSSTMR